jgi:hypothetical protein
MMPRYHFIIAAVITAVYAYVTRSCECYYQFGGWALLSGGVAALMDMDVILITRQAAKKDPDLEPFVNPKEATRDLTEFLVLLYHKGLLVRVGATHLTTAVVVTVIAYFLAPEWFIPVAIGAWSHLASDVPYLWRIKIEADSVKGFGSER